MMMLTEDTADRLRVSNRLDPAQSIRAAARYLADLRDELPATVKEPDRTWLALAAYNLGQGHLNGARQFAAGMKRDANSWYEMKRILPLMARPEYYARLKSGRARGGEAVIMVENIRSYYGVLRRFESSYGAGLSLSKPPMYGIKADGTSTVPSPF
jgi:membrane-bound lytic murein transglycosylase F